MARPLRPGATGPVAAALPFPSRLALPIAAALAAILAWPTAAEAQRQRVTSAEISFGIYALGAKGVEISLSTRRAAETVQVVETEMRTAGMLDWAMRFSLTGQVMARLDEGRLRPLRYAIDSDGTWSKRITRMTWREDGLPIVDMLEPPVEEEDREPVSLEQMRGTSDPTTALIARALRGGAEPPCSGMDAIFDGRRRYNLHYTALGPDWVKPHNRSAYSGPAVKCQVKIEPVAGYTRQYLAEWSAKDEEPTQVWLVQPDGYDAWLPVQLEGGFRLGAASGWISGARLNGREWLAPLGPIRAEIPREITP